MREDGEAGQSESSGESLDRDVVCPVDLPSRLGKVVVETPRHSVIQA